MTGRSVVIGRDGRAKAYRPLPDDRRAEAVAAGVQAYAAGDFFEAHELWEPAWMGTDVPADRALLQGLIKLAAAYVHGVRGNPAGIIRNLEGGRARLAESQEEPGAPGTDSSVPWLDVPALIAAIDLRLADLAAHADGPTLGPPDLPRRPA
jgi:predicted metal-dependent hydrolase